MRLARGQTGRAQRVQICHGQCVAVQNDLGPAAPANRRVVNRHGHRAHALSPSIFAVLR
jgi:hypothetical protein